MISAAVVTTLLEFPQSAVHALIPSPTCRRVLIGLAMGATAVGLIYSPLGKRSGAHLNPAVTLTFYRLGKIDGVDALGYIVAQTLGGLAGLLVAVSGLGAAIEHPAVNYVVTVPGEAGVATAFSAEALISFGLMLTVLFLSNHRTLAPMTGLAAGLLVATYIGVEAPLSGMSMNPARTFASAMPAHLWTAFWIYLTAPVIGMLLAAEVYARARSLKQVYCAKLHHQNGYRCIFHCKFDNL
jgi:aquaporin Z